MDTPDTARLTPVYALGMDSAALQALDARVRDFALVAPGLVLKYGRSKWMRLAVAPENGVQVTMEPETGALVSMRIRSRQMWWKLSA